MDKAVGSLLAALFPSDCRFCQASLFSLSRLPVCNSCIESIRPIQFASCTRCGDLLALADSNFGDACCPRCSSESPEYERAVNFSSYTGALRKLIHLLKYERVRVAAKPLGHLAAEACRKLQDEISASDLLMIPVPAHKTRLRARGFNQAELIARAARRPIEQILGRRLTLETSLLLRTRFVGSQVARTAEERRQQIRGAFKVTTPARLKGRTILLIDDVLTTGATAAECSRELRHAGAAEVWVATPARALSRIAMGSFDRPEEVFPEYAGRVFSASSSCSVSLSLSGPAQSPVLLRRGIASNHAVEQRAGVSPLGGRLL